MTINQVTTGVFVPQKLVKAKELLPAEQQDILAPARPTGELPTVTKIEPAKPNEPIPTPPPTEARPRCLLAETPEAPPAQPAPTLQQTLEQMEVRRNSTAQLQTFEGGYTAQHMQRSARYSLALADHLQGTPWALNRQEKAALDQAAPLYDLGKLAVPEEFWNKPGKPSPDEWAAMQGHVNVDAPQVRKLFEAHGVTGDAALSVVRHHHERFDGKGYPDHLAGDQIPKGSALLGIADTFDSLTCDRPFRAGKSYPDAAAILRDSAQKGQFDPGLVDVFLNKVVSSQEALNVYK